MQEFIEFLKDRLKLELPGINSHRKMAPILDEKLFRSFKVQRDAKDSAVMVPLILLESELSILFTLRSKNISHSGQISFPGGRCENNETYERTAMRETFEETGVNEDKFEIIGRLSDLYVPLSNSLIHPIVGLIKKEFIYKANQDEVAEIFQVSFEKFLDKEFYKEEFWDFNGVNVKVPFWNVHNSKPLWGATAMILQELIDIYREFIGKN